MTANLAHLQRLLGTRYEYGVNHGMLAVPFKRWEKEDLYGTTLDPGIETLLDNDYLMKGIPWNGLTKVSEKVTGGELNHQWADNEKYIGIRTPEAIEGSVEFYTYPEELDEYSDATPIAPGLTIGGQSKRTSSKTFSIVYSTTRVTLLSEGLAKPEEVFHILNHVRMDTSEISHETMEESSEPDLYSLEFKSDPIATLYSTKKGLRPFSKVELVPYNVHDRPNMFYNIFRNRIWTPLSELVEPFAAKQWMENVGMVSTLDYYIYILGEGN